MKKRLFVTAFIFLIYVMIFTSCSNVKALSFDEDVYTVKIGSEITPTVTVRPAKSDYSLSVANETIAEVNGSKVKGLKSGITVLTVKAGKQTATARLIVSDVTSPGEIGYTVSDSHFVTFNIVNFVDLGLESGLIESRVCSDGSTVSRDLPAYEGYNVTGWFTDPQCTVSYGTQTPVRDNLNLYCKASILENSFVIDENRLLLGLRYKKLPHGALTLPESVNGISVEGVAANAFAGDTLLTEVYIPSSYKSIGSFAFAGCIALSKVELGENSALESIGKFAFGFTAESVKGEEEVERVVSGENPCERLESINLPDSVKEIGAFAFGYCSSLSLSAIPSQLTVIEYGAFAKTRISDVDLNNVTTIKAFAFLDCASLLTVRNSSHVTECGTDAFYGTAFYKSQVNSSPYIVYADTMIVGCSPSYGKLVGGRFTVPDRVTLIADGAFSSPNQAELSVYFPKPGVIIGNKSFLVSEGVCLVAGTVEDGVLQSYIDAVKLSDHAEYVPLFCQKLDIDVTGEDGVNYGIHTLLKFSDQKYYYDLFTRKRMESDPSKLKSPQIIDLSVLPEGKFIERINIRAISFGTYVSGADAKEHYGGNLTTLIMPTNLKSVAIFAISQCGRLSTVDMTKCFYVPEVVPNSIQFSTVGTENPQKTKVLVLEENYALYRSSWTDCGVIRDYLSAK